MQTNEIPARRGHEVMDANHFDLAVITAAWKDARARRDKILAERPAGAPRGGFLMDKGGSRAASWLATDEQGRKVALICNLDTSPELLVLLDSRTPKIIGRIDLKAPDAQEQLARFTPREAPLDIEATKATLGTMWGLDRPLHNSELARALRLGGRDPGRSVQDWSTGATRISGPASVAIQMMLAGAVPPDPMPIIVAR